jgi:hypothetical protein
MEPEQSLLLKRVIAKNQIFENLNANPDFIAWREDVVNRRLEFLKESVLGVDRSRADWKEELSNNLVAYQELRLQVEFLFAAGLANAVSARKKLQEPEQVQ